VSYDNLVNLLAAMSLYYLFLFWQRREGAALLAFGTAALAGCLTKMAFLPLAAILGLVLVVRERRTLVRSPVRLLGPLRRLSPREAALTAALVALAIGNLSLHGGNLLRYGTIQPRAARLLGLEAALENRIFARNYITRQFREGRLGFEEAMARTQEIDHEPTRRGTQALLRRARRQASQPEPRLGPVRYAARWAGLMLERTFGYFGHMSVTKSWLGLLPYWLALTLAAAGLVRGWRAATWSAPHPTAALVIAAFYVLVLIGRVNYPSYLRTGVLGLAVQGRYLFPVMLPIWGLVAQYLLELFPARVRPVVGLVAGAYFVYGDFPFFLHEAEEESWFVW
jgi:hypothetical protein